MTFAQRAVWLVGMVLLTTPAFAQSPDPGQVLARLRANHPGVRVLEHTGLVRTVCARPMTSAATPRQAADEWLSQYAGVFGAGSPELVLESSRRISGGKHALTYRQHVGGLTVEGSVVKLVIHEQRVSRVVYACAKVSLVPPGGFGPPAVASAAALAAARAHPAAATLPNWRAPELIVVFADPTLREIDGALAWKCVGSGGPMGRSVAVYVDAFSGSVLRMVELTLSSGSDITGTVTGNATPGTEPDIGGTGVCDNPAQNTLLPYLLVEALDGNGAVLGQTYTAADGSYNLTAPSAAAVRASLIGPSWTVFDQTLPGSGFLPPPLTKSVAPPFPVIRDFQFNTSPTAGETAQINAFLNVGRTWEYFTIRLAPGDPLPGLNDDIPVVVNSAFAPCAAWYDNILAPLIYFGFEQPAPALCANLAYSTIVSHEYGHYLADIMLGIGVEQAAFHEGFGDTLAHLVHDTELYGENWRSCCTLMRDPLNIRVPPPSTCQSTAPGNRKYPDCEPAIHTRGMLLSGIWLDLLRNMRDTHGSSQGLELTRQLHVDWCFVTAGERPATDECPNIRQVADVGTLIEVLTADVDGGSFAGGTPHCAEILDAFEKHGIAVDPADIGLGCGESASAGGRACAADLDTTTGPGVLDIFDYMAFQRLFAARDPAACDCDTTDGLGLCDIFDFLCFQNAFVAGCP